MYVCQACIVADYPRACCEQLVGKTATNGGS